MPISPQGVAFNASVARGVPSHVAASAERPLSGADIFRATLQMPNAMNTIASVPVNRDMYREPTPFFGTVGTQLHTSALMTDPMYQQRAISTVQDEFATLHLPDARMSMQSNMRTPQEAADVLSYAAENANLLTPRGVNPFQNQTRVAGQISDVMNARGYDASNAAQVVADQYISENMGRAFERNTARFGNLPSDIQTELTSRNQRTSVGEIVAARGLVGGMSEVQNDPNLSGEQRASLLSSMNYTSALIATNELGRQSPGVADILSSEFVTNPGALPSASLPLHDYTQQQIAPLTSAAQAGVSQGAYAEAFGGGSIVGGSGGSGGGSEGGGGSGGEDPMKRITEMFAQAIQQMIESMNKASEGLKTLGEDSKKALPAPGAAPGTAPSAAPSPISEEQLNPLARREMRLFDAQLAAGGVSGGSIGFLRGIFGQGVFQSDARATRYANVAGRSLRGLGGLARGGLSGLGNTGAGSDFASFMSGLPGYSRGFEGFGLLRQYAQSNAQGELPALQAQQLLGQSPQTFGNYSANTLDDIFQPLGIAPTQAAQIVAQAAQSQGGAMTRGLERFVASAISQGYDPNAYLSNIAQQRSMGFRGDPALEFNTARGMGLTGNAAIGMQAQLFGTFLQASTQNLGITREGYYNRVLGMGRMADGTTNIARGAAVFGRGQGVISQASQMLASPYQGLAPTLMMSEALRQTNGDQVAAMRLLERYQAQGGAGMQQLLSALPPDIQQMALSSAGLNLRDQRSINQRSPIAIEGANSPIFSDNPVVNLEPNMRVSQELATSEYARTRNLYSDRGMAYFKAAEGQTRVVEEFQTGDRIVRALGVSAGNASQGLSDMTKSAIEVTNALDSIAKGLRSVQQPILQSVATNINQGNYFSAAVAAVGLGVFQKLKEYIGVNF